LKFIAPFSCPLLFTSFAAGKFRTLRAIPPDKLALAIAPQNASSSSNHEEIIEGTEVG
jgi:hypothetical protein